jgi:hypothetical protein
VLEPKSQIAFAAPAHRRTILGAVSRGIGAERLFWRHWAREGRGASLLAHPVSTLVDAVRHEGIITGSLKLLGRTLGLKNIRASVEYESQLLAASELLGDLEVRGETFSLPASRDEQTVIPARHRPVRQRAA